MMDPLPIGIYLLSDIQPNNKAGIKYRVKIIWAEELLTGAIVTHSENCRVLYALQIVNPHLEKHGAKIFYYLVNLLKFKISTM